MKVDKNEMLGVTREEMIDFIAKALGVAVGSFVSIKEENMLKIIRQMATEYTDDAIREAKEKRDENN